MSLVMGGVWDVPEYSTSIRVHVDFGVPSQLFCPNLWGWTESQTLVIGPTEVPQLSARDGRVR